MTLFDVIKQIAPLLEASQDINAMWIEGSWATGKNHEQSDIDVWLDVKGGTFTEAIGVFRQALASLGDIDWEDSRGVYSQNPKLQKHTFHLSGFSEPQCIELDLQEHSREFVFDKQEHIIKVLFDKNNTIRWKNT